MTKYVKLDDVLALLPETDITGPKPSRLRKEVTELPTVELEPGMYLIYEDTLTQILADHYRLCALEQGGVDNWSWYCDACHDWLKEVIPSNLDEDEAWEYDFVQFAKDMIPMKFMEVKDVK